MMLLHTTDKVPGREISDSLGMIEVHLWDPDDDFFEVLEKDLREAALALGGDAVVGVQVAFIGPSGGYKAGTGQNALASLSGTVVRLEK